MKSQLTPEESQRLIELGVDPAKASESRIVCKEPYLGAPNRFCNDVNVPIFTLTDILSLLPREIEIGGIMTLNIKWVYSAWFASYIDEDGSTTNGFYGIELIDALYELLVWCITNKHLKL